MSLRIAVQMDPIDQVDVSADTTFLMIENALERGHQVWTYHPEQLAQEGGAITARARPLAGLTREQGRHARHHAVECIDLASMDVVLLRQDPPFDMAYITSTHMLERIHPKTLVVNDPGEVRNAPEKLYVTTFAGLQPPTLITRDPHAIADFRELTDIKIAAGVTGLFMVGGGVPKNFAQDTVVCAEILGVEADMHKYAVQITVADVRDGACSSSTLQEAASWGKVQTGWEQMVLAEATTVVPLIASDAWHRGTWKGREKRRWAKLFA